MKIKAARHPLASQLALEEAARPHRDEAAKRRVLEARRTKAMVLLRMAASTKTCRS